MIMRLILLICSFIVQWPLRYELDSVRNLSSMGDVCFFSIPLLERKKSQLIGKNGLGDYSIFQDHEEQTRDWLKATVHILLVYVQNDMTGFHSFGRESKEASWLKKFVGTNLRAT